MRETYFKGTDWTKSFVSGPLKPSLEPVQVLLPNLQRQYIHLWKKSPRDPASSQSERHLRKDQRWQYEHLSTEDPTTKVVKRHVRGKDGRLQLQLPKLIEVQLVDIGEKLQ